MPSKDNVEKNQSAKTTEKNPCGICRAMGSPTCKGHGGSGGGSETKGNEKSANESSMSSRKDLELSITKSELWVKADEDFTYKFTNPDALMSLTIDMGLGLIRFTGKEDLSVEQQKILDVFYQQIINEFTALKNELSAKGVDVQRMLIETGKDHLTIKIPNLRCYDAFVQRLMNKNLIITQVEPRNTKSLTAPDRGDAQEYRSTAPTPFDISGPKPKGWDGR